MNLYLYLPPGSCHSPGMLKGLIHGAVRKTFALCSDTSDITPFLRKTFQQLTVLGHAPASLKPIFEEARKKTQQLPSTSTPHRRQWQDNRDEKSPVQPIDVPLKEIQQAFRMNIMHPPHGKYISAIDTMNKNGGPVDFNCLTICYHEEKNLGAILAPRKLCLGDNSVNAAITALQEEESH